jgi:hypothetical protein
MRHELSTGMKDAIADYVAQYKKSGKILDVYKAAASIRERHPMDDVALDDVIERLVLSAGSDYLIEFHPPRACAELRTAGMDGSPSTASSNVDGAT